MGGHFFIYTLNTLDRHFLTYVISENLDTREYAANPSIEGQEISLRRRQTPLTIEHGHASPNNSSLPYIGDYQTKYSHSLMNDSHSL